MNNQTHSPTSQINKRQIGILFVLFSTLILGLMAASQVLYEQPNLTHTNTLSAASTTTASLTVYRTEAPPTPVRTTEPPRTRENIRIISGIVNRKLERNFCWASFYLADEDGEQ
jgi:hypothetical protein